MPPTFSRRTATKVKDGRVQRKNRSRPSGHEGYVLHRESPGHGFRHVVSKREVQQFLDIVPGWAQLSERLERIVLAAHCEGTDAWHTFYRREDTGAVFLCAWPVDSWIEVDAWYFEVHQPLFTRLGVSYDRTESGVTCRFTEAQARAYVLLHVLMHELGHHHDRLHQKHVLSTKGEDYAEHFANSRLDQLWPEYVRVFGHPAGRAG